MNKTLLHPQEIETFYIIPTLRRYFASYMKKRGMKQKEIAQILGISSATISQYVSNKRAHQLDFPVCVLQSIKESAIHIVDRGSYIKHTQKILYLIRSQNVLCKIHKKFADVPNNCDPEEMGCIHK